MIVYQEEYSLSLARSFGFCESRYTERQPTATSYKKQKDTKALFDIQQLVIDTMFARIMDCLKVKKVWDIFQEKFQVSVEVKIIKLFQTLISEFEI